MNLVANLPESWWNEIASTRVDPNSDRSLESRVNRWISNTVAKRVLDSKPIPFIPRERGKNIEGRVTGWASDGTYYILRARMRRSPYPLAVWVASIVGEALGKPAVHGTLDRPKTDEEAPKRVLSSEQELARRIVDAPTKNTDDALRLAHLVLARAK